jgi:hypothetical protein
MLFFIFDFFSSKNNKIFSAKNVVFSVKNQLILSHLTNFNTIVVKKNKIV